MFWMISKGIFDMYFEPLWSCLIFCGFTAFVRSFKGRICYAVCVWEEFKWFLYPCSRQASSRRPATCTGTETMAMEAVCNAWRQLPYSLQQLVSIKFHLGKQRATRCDSIQLISQNALISLLFIWPLHPHYLSFMTFCPSGVCCLFNQVVTQWSPFKLMCVTRWIQAEHWLFREVCVSIFYHRCYFPETWQSRFLCHSRYMFQWHDIWFVASK